MSDRFMGEALRIYSSQNIAFEPRWFPLFSLLAREPRVAVGQAATALGITHAAVSQTVQDMQRRGIVTSVADPQDKRRAVLTLSPKGRELLAQLSPLWKDIRSAVDEAVGATGVDLVAALARLERTLDDESLFERTRKMRQSDGVAIVDYRPAFKTAFRKLNEAWIKKYFRLEAADRKVLADPQGEILDRGGYILFAVEGKTVLGCCALYAHGAREFELAKMAVTPEAQGRQIGRRLMEAAIARVKTAGAKRLVLETNDQLTPAVTLYKSVGFKAKRGAKSDLFERANLIMELKLA
jgi:DNA-binding MarR family transcriptional regulator/predicted GNAT family acetyltransferase